MKINKSQSPFFSQHLKNIDISLGGKWTSQELTKRLLGPENGPSLVMAPMPRAHYYLWHSCWGSKSVPAWVGQSTPRTCEENIPFMPLSPDPETQFIIITILWILNYKKKKRKSPPSFYQEGTIVCLQKTMSYVVLGRPWPLCVKWDEAGSSLLETFAV